MSRLFFVFSVSLLFTACSDTPLPTVDPDGGTKEDGSVVFSDAAADGPTGPKEVFAVKAGTRLHPLSYVVDGLSFWSEVWKDTQLDMECRFAAFSDGSIRCVPPPLDKSFFVTFSDSSCTGAEMIFLPNSMLDKWRDCGIPTAERYIYMHGDACPPMKFRGLKDYVDRIFLPGKEVQPDKTYENIDGVCEEVAYGGSPGHFFEVSELDLSPFVRAEVAEVQSLAGKRLALVEVVGEDGSRERISYFDTQRSERCAFSMAADKTYRCMPSYTRVRASSSEFADANCTELLATVYGDSCEGEKYAYNVHASAETCWSVWRIYELGASHDQLFIDFSGECQASEPFRPMFRLGPEVPSSSFSGGGIGAGDAGGRLKPYEIDVDIAPRPTVGVWDSQLNVKCSFATASDGKNRCLPRGYAAGSSYSDAQCSVPLVSSYLCPMETPYASKAIYNAGACTYHYSIYERGAEISASATVYGMFSDGVCRTLTRSETSYYYAVGAEVPPERFVEAELK